MEELHLEPISDVLYQNIPCKNDTIDSISASFSQPPGQISPSLDFHPQSSLLEQNTSSYDDSTENMSSEDQNSQGCSISKRKYFTKEEDHLLTTAAMRFNQESWNNIAKYVPGKTPKQCRDRWVNYLQPSLKFSPWSENEDQLLVSLVNEHGTHWTKMRNFFPNRSTNCLKNRWHWLIKNRIKVLPIKQTAFYASNNSSNGQFQNLSKNCNIINSEPKNIINNNQNNNNQHISNNINSNSKYSVLNVHQQNNNQYFYLINEKAKRKKSSILKLKHENQNKEVKFNQKMKNRFFNNNNSEINFHILDESELISFNPEELNW